MTGPWTFTPIYWFNAFCQLVQFVNFAGIKLHHALKKREPLMAPLITMTAFDLGQDRLPCFASYRFLYERLIGAAVRPWLPGAFCAAAALPHLHPDRRRTLLQSISEAAATAPGWSNREPVFYPEWVEKVDTAAAA